MTGKEEEVERKKGELKVERRRRRRRRKEKHINERLLFGCKSWSGGHGAVTRC